MKISRERLRQIIAEEAKDLIKENQQLQQEDNLEELTTTSAPAASAGSSLGGFAQVIALTSSGQKLDRLLPTANAPTNSVQQGQLEEQGEQNTDIQVAAQVAAKAVNNSSIVNMIKSISQNAFARNATFSLIAYTPVAIAIASDVAGGKDLSATQAALAYSTVLFTTIGIPLSSLAADVTKQDAITKISNMVKGAKQNVTQAYNRAKTMNTPVPNTGKVSGTRVMGPSGTRVTR